MADIITGRAVQGLASEHVTLADGEVLTIIFDRDPIHWDFGGFSWVVQPGSGASVMVEHSLVLNVDTGVPIDWTADPGSPYTESREGSERFRISAIRFTPTGGGATVAVLSPAKFTMEV